jgi:hypothetical protein
MIPCTDTTQCVRCGERWHCTREYLHKGFHGALDHTWDEYGQVYCEVKP